MYQPVTSHIPQNIPKAHHTEEEKHTRQILTLTFNLPHTSHLQGEKEPRNTPTAKTNSSINVSSQRSHTGAAFPPRWHHCGSNALRAALCTRKIRSGHAHDSIFHLLFFSHITIPSHFLPQLHRHRSRLLIRNIH